MLTGGILEVEPHLKQRSQDFVRLIVQARAYERVRMLRLDAMGCQHSGRSRSVVSASAAEHWTSEPARERSVSADAGRSAGGGVGERDHPD